MLHTKFQGNNPSGSGEEDFFEVFAIHGHGGHLAHVTLTKYVNFLLPFALRLHMKFKSTRPGFPLRDAGGCRLPSYRLPQAWQPSWSCDPTHL